MTDQNYPTRDELARFAEQNLLAMCRTSISEMHMPPAPVLLWLIHYLPVQLLEEEKLAIDAQALGTTSETNEVELHNAVVDVIALLKVMERNQQLGMLHDFKAALSRRKLHLPLSFDATHGGRIP